MPVETLFGFIGEVHGNEGQILAMDAVSVRDSSFIRYPAGEGVSPRPLKHEDVEYVTPIESPEDIDWAPGHVVWFAGRHLIARATLESIQGFTAGWHATRAGYRLSSGTAADFRRWKNSIAEKLTHQFRRYITDGWEIRVGDARTAWELCAAFDSSASKRRSINAALYFYEVDKNQKRFDDERKRAVRNGAFDSLDAFDEEFARTQNFLHAPRATDVPVQRPPEGPSTQAEATGDEVSALGKSADILALLLSRVPEPLDVNPTVRWLRRIKNDSERMHSVDFEWTVKHVLISTAKPALSAITGNRPEEFPLTYVMPPLFDTTAVKLHPHEVHAPDERLELQ